MPSAVPANELATGTDQTKRRLRHLLVAVLPYLAAAVGCGLILGSLYRPWKRDLHIPFEARGDAYFGQVVAKNFVENGKFYINPWLGAPGEQELYDFPLPHWTHLIVWAILKLFTRSYGLLLNLYFLLTFPLAAFTALYAFRRVGISAWIATAGAVLYAILPFHLLRAESHLSLAALYTLPLAALIIIWIATGNPLFGFQLPADAPSRPYITRDGLIAIVACVLMGWDDPYYAFFTAGLMLVGGLLGSFRNEHRRALLAAAITCTVVTAALLIALLPNFIYFHRHGPTMTAHRMPVDSETYGLTLIQLLAPVRNHRIPAFAQWRANYDANAILVNENSTVCLGSLASIGFLLSLVSLFQKRCPEFLHSLGTLNLSAFLLGTIGGAGAIFAFVISPQIRAYNRIAPFIGFFSITALIWMLDQWMRSRGWDVKPGMKIVIPVALVTIGVLDQIPRHYLRPWSSIEPEFNEQAAFIQQIEKSVPPGSMIFQLPYMKFPENGLPAGKMIDYDHFIGYLHSRTLRWSYGAMRNTNTDQWLATVSAEPPGEMVNSVKDAGFAGIYVDRFGYSDNAAALESQLRTVLPSEPVSERTGRYLFFPIAQAR